MILSRILLGVTGILLLIFQVGAVFSGRMGSFRLRGSDPVALVLAALLGLGLAVMTLKGWPKPNPARSKAFQRTGLAGITLVWINLLPLLLRWYFNPWMAVWICLGLIGIALPMISGDWRPPGTGAEPVSPDAENLRITQEERDLLRMERNTAREEVQRLARDLETSRKDQASASAQITSLQAEQGKTVEEARSLLKERDSVLRERDTAWEKVRQLQESLAASDVQTAMWDRIAADMATSAQTLEEARTASAVARPGSGAEQIARGRVAELSVEGEAPEEPAARGQGEVREGRGSRRERRARKETLPPA